MSSAAVVISALANRMCIHQYVIRMDKVLSLVTRRGGILSKWLFLHWKSRQTIHMIRQALFSFKYKTNQRIVHSML